MSQSSSGGYAHRLLALFVSAVIRQQKQASENSASRVAHALQASRALTSLCGSHASCSGALCFGVRNRSDPIEAGDAATSGDPLPCRQRPQH